MYNKFLRYSFFILLIIATILAIIIKDDSYLLTAIDAPKGQLSLQLNQTDSVQTKIMNEWHQNKAIKYNFRDTTIVKTVTGIDVAKQGIYTDYGFIATYVLLLAAVCYRLKPIYNSKLWLLIGLILILITGIADILEDIGMLDAISIYCKSNGKIIVPSSRIYIPSITKWSILTLLSIIILIRLFILGYIQLFFVRLSINLSKLAALIWQFRIQVLALLILFAALYKSDQGQDLLLTLNTSVLGTVFFLILATVSALLNWYLPKMIENYNIITFKTFFTGNFNFQNVNKKTKVDLARLAGALTFLLPAVCILKAMQNFYILESFVEPILILLVITWFYYAALKYSWFEKWYLDTNQVLKKPKFYITVIFIGVIIPLLGIFDYVSRHDPVYLGGLVIDLILLSFLFLILTSLRAHIPITQNLILTPYIIFSGLSVFLIFALCNLFAKQTAFNHGYRFLTLPIFYSAVIFYLLTFSVLLIVGTKVKIQFITFIFSAGIFISATKPSSFHQIDLKKDTSKFKKDSLSYYARQWLLSRKDTINKFAAQNKPYPVFFINSYGGGIKAAAFTSMVIGSLDSVTLANSIKNNRKTAFQDFTFAYTGASGGIVGLSLTYAARYKELKENRSDNLLNVSSCYTLYANDYLTPVMIAMTGRDIWMSSIGLNWYDDRQKLQEKAWECHIKKKNIAYDAMFSSFWLLEGSSKYKLPLLFINTFDAVSGNKAIIAPVKFSTINFPSVINLQDTINKLSKEPRELKLSTVAFLSARFPFVSPTGNLNDRYHFVDAGYNDNSGSETLTGIVKVFQQELDKLQKEDSKVYKNIEINIISISHSIVDDRGLEKAKVMSEITAPLVGALNNGDGNANKAETISCINAKVNRYKYFPIRPTHARTQSGIWPVLPLGWQISDDALDELRISVKQDKRLDTIAFKTRY